MKPLPHVLVFADVDHTFLTRSPRDVAAETHEILRGNDATLVLCSSMTRAELEMCQHELDIRQPFICESGAAVLMPHGYFPFDVPSDRDIAGYHAIVFGRPYEEVVTLLHHTAGRLQTGILGFTHLSVEQVAAEFHLSLSQARLAKLREYNEPFRVIDSVAGARERLFRSLHAVGLRCTFRGIYDHVGAGVDKGASVDLLTTLYQRARGPVITVGVGDATNSLPLLHRVKIPFIAHTEPVSITPRSSSRIPRIRLAPGRGPLLEAIAEVAQYARHSSSAYATG
jgi:mannosyl-3-phosphoglycerate phosphatase family protein